MAGWILTDDLQIGVPGIAVVLNAALSLNALAFVATWQISMLKLFARITDAKAEA